MKIKFLSLLIICTLNVHAGNHDINLTFSNQKSIRNPDSLKLDSLIKKTSFRFNQNRFEGKGWDMLLKEMEKVQFVMIGEEHGEAEIPLFVTHIAKVFKPKALISEIDPHTAERLKKISLHPEKYSSYMQKNPYDFAFFSWAEEMELARSMQVNKIDIWGLNEINFLSLGTFFETLAEQAKSPANKKIALERAKAYRKNDQPLYYDVNRFGEFSAYKLKTAAIDSLLFNFRNENALCKKMLNDLKMSIPVFANTEYDLRVNVMKKNLINYLAPQLKEEAINLPKLLFKFGANHLSRTNDAMGYFEVGSLADQLADAANKKTLHVMIFGKKGMINMMAPVNNSLAIQPYDFMDSSLSGFKPFMDKLEDQEWATYDLRPIRRAINKGELKISNKSLRKFIMGYDLLVVFEKLTASKFIE